MYLPEFMLRQHNLPAQLAKFFIVQLPLHLPVFHNCPEHFHIYRHIGNRKIFLLMILRFSLIDNYIFIQYYKNMLLKFPFARQKYKKCDFKTK